jgi:D-beta-D-heptose 7-phosphate kinase / D-beta-D-heptose 1-phosphate adenosyltransferase
MDALLNHLASWKPFRALVLGDFMLDQLIFGDAERLSADAPVPILHVRERQHRPGGAANVCLDLLELARTDLGGSVTALGVIGDDQTGSTLALELRAKGVRVDGLVKDPTRPTTVKQNFIGRAQTRHPQKMFRVDEESREPLSPVMVDRLFSAFESELPGVDVVCIEDYAKGVCTPELCRRVIDACRGAGVPVMVDPAKIADYSKYRGATVITPNRTEAEFAAGLSTCGDATIEKNAPVARKLLEGVALDAVVLTLDRHGALLMERGSEPEDSNPAAPGEQARSGSTPGARRGRPLDAVAVPTVARQVYDVTGAGDMFLAGLAAARCNGCSWLDAVRFANAAAGLEVEIFGVEPIPLEKIHHSLLAMSTAEHGKTRTLEQALVEASALRRTAKRVVFTNGCFDVLHAGHVALLEAAAREGDFLIVGLNDDASVKRLKGPERPVNHQEDRARVLGSLGCVGAVVLFSEDTPIRLIETLRPDVLVKGGDYTKDRVVGGSFVESCGGRVALVDLVDGRSTTDTIRRLRGDTKPAGV